MVVIISCETKYLFTLILFDIFIFMHLYRFSIKSMNMGSIFEIYEAPTRLLLSCFYGLIVVKIFLQKLRWLIGMIVGMNNWTGANQNLTVNKDFLFQQNFQQELIYPLAQVRKWFWHFSVKKFWDLLLLLMFLFIWKSFVCSFGEHSLVNLRASASAP